MQLEIAKRFREDFLDLFGQEIALGGHTNVLISRTNLLSTCESHASVTAMFRRFRHISLTHLALGKDYVERIDRYLLHQSWWKCVLRVLNCAPSFKENVN